MSSQSLAGLGKELPRYTWDQVKELASKLAYQDLKDSPVIPYYTNWKALQQAEVAEQARETVKPLLPPGLSEEKADIYMGAPGDYKLASGKYIARSHLSVWSLPIDGKIAAIHALKWHDGVAIDEPGDYIIILAGGDGYVGHHVEIRVPGKSKTKLVMLESTPATGVSTRSLNISVEEGATLDLTLIVADKGPSYTTGLIKLEAGASVTERILLIPGDMTHVKLDAVLKGAKSEAHLRASTVAKGKVRSDLITNTLHLGAESTGIIVHRGVSEGGALAVHRGSARITPTAQWSQAEVESAFMIVDNESTAVSVPVLEVETGNVKNARHATIVAPPPDDVLFYLAQRGLSRSEAIKLMEEGVIGLVGIHETLRVGVEDLYAWIERSVKDSG